MKSQARKPRRPHQRRPVPRPAHGYGRTAEVDTVEADTADAADDDAMDLGEYGVGENKKGRGARFEMGLEKRDREWSMLLVGRVLFT